MSPTRRNGPTAHPTVQSRAQETVERLVTATEACLARDGLDGATVPAIAEQAGVAVGTVYRRFPDKDALLKIVYERYFARAREWNRAAFASVDWSRYSARAIVSSYVAGMVMTYRKQRKLLSALTQFAERHEDKRFRDMARELSEEGLRGLEARLLERRAEIGHPEPEHAVRFALRSLAIVARGILLTPGADSIRQSMDDEALTADLTRMMLAYLAIGGESDC